MSRVYAKIRSSAHVTCKALQILFVFATLSLLSACGSSYSLPFGSAYSTGVVTKDPNSIPNIGWQTQGQRQVLVDQNNAMTGQQPAAPDQQNVVLVPPPEATPPVVAAPLATSSSGKVTVSLLVPLTGKKADLGQSMLKAAQMALFDIGSANFELVPRDTKSTKDGAVAAAKAAVASHTSLILGPVFAEDLRAIKPVLAGTDIPVISFTTDWTLADEHTYIMGFLPFTQVARVAKYAQEHGYGRMAVYAPQTEYCDVVIRTLQDSGMNIVRINRYAPQQTDLSMLVQDFASSSKSSSSPNKLDFDALMLPLGSEGLRSLVNVLDANGIDQSKAKFIGTGLWDDTSLTSNPGLHGGWFAAPDPALRSDFEKRFQENYGAFPLRLSSLAYDATALSAVLARSGSSMPYTRDALTNPRGFAGIDGIFRFRPDGLSERGLAILEIRSGKNRVVDTAPTAFISSGS